MCEVEGIGPEEATDGALSKLLFYFILILHTNHVNRKTPVDPSRHKRTWWQTVQIPIKVSV